MFSISLVMTLVALPQLLEILLAQAYSLNIQGSHNLWTHEKMSTVSIPKHQ